MLFMVLHDLHFQLCARVFTRRIQFFLLALVFAEAGFAIPVTTLYPPPRHLVSPPMDDAVTFEEVCMSNTTDFARAASTLGIEV